MYSLFKSLNLRLSAGVQWRLPKRFRFPFTLLYEQQVLFLGNRLQEGTILDIGAGFLTPTNRSTGLNEGIHIIGMDISETALQKNMDVDFRIVGDACEQWPIADASIDIVISRSVIEHLRDTRTFIRECRRVLKPGGYCVHLLPGRNAPFAVLNRVLPKKVSRRLLDWAYPHKKEELGFPAFYQDCTFFEIKRLLESKGFAIEEIFCRYYQSTYYASVFPIYLISTFYDLLIWKLGVKRLSSQILAVAFAPTNINESASPG